jgi:hypothetical protein
VTTARSSPPVAAAALLLLLLALSLGGPGTASAQSRKPLLMEGKTTLFQRVLTRPGAKLAEGVGAPGTVAVPPFTPLYVYERLPVDGGGPTYLEVGSDAKGKVVGFLQEPETIEWKHSLVLAFAPRASRDRTLFFTTREALDEWLASDQVIARAEEARRIIDGDGALPAASPIASIEPEAYVDFETNFYMLPILEAKSKRLPSGFRVREVRIASVTREEAKPATEQPLRRRVNPEALDTFRAGVVFVIDASSSMQPYITRTRTAMERVLQRVEEAGLGDRVRFGLVAYRDDPDKVVGVEYLTRTFADPNVVKGSEEFTSAIEPLSASKVSTRDFSEDSFAAIDEAFRGIDWSGFGGRFLVLITDASSREGNSPFSTTGLNTAEVGQLVRANNAALYTLHLKTPVGKDDHAKAEAQYSELSRYPGVGSLYFPVEAGDPATFEATIERLAEALVAQVAEARKAVAQPAPAPEPEPTAKPAATIEETAALVGRAMALAHLGRAENVEAPPMFEAWASDRDFKNPDVAAFTVRVLLSKSQLSDLQRTLQLTVDALEAGQINPSDLFNQIRSASVAMGRDPSRVGQGDVKNLEATGLMGEYLEGLPYQSNLMSLTEDDWVRMGVSEQQSIIDGVYSKIRLYQRFHDDAARWIALNEGDEPGDWVFPVPIDALP